VIIDIDPHGAVPAYEQLRAQLTELVASGTLAAGTRLPSIRQLASDLGLAPGTVARAFRELESDGLVTSRVRHGTVVAGRHPAATPGEEGAAERMLDDAARTFALAARRLGVSDDGALRALRTQLEALPHQG
jgi:DNA-binding transcriptional regulator YhcF (GntR family)